jgi:hypothetical protein
VDPQPNWLLPLAAIGTTPLMSRLIFAVATHPAKAVSDALQSVLRWQALWPVAAAKLISVVAGWKVSRNKWSISPDIPHSGMLVAIS